MNEQEWLVSTDPQAMLAWIMLDGEVSGRSYVGLTYRKLRLFACACCRAVWHLLTDECSRRAVEAAERFADGEAPEKELAAAWDAVRDAVRDAAQGAAWDAAQGAAWDAARAAARKDQAAFLRDIVGDPFRPYVRAKTASEAKYLKSPCINPDWLTWNGGTVPKLARAAYLERPGRECGDCQATGWVYDQSLTAREGDTLPCDSCHGIGKIEDGTLDPERLLVLADALDEAGCTDAALLTHLRGPGPHVRGCWCVDLLLGLS